ncbi:NAD(P)-binding Rossmann-fold superfamily protein [Hibiscus syriacus]|uniref:NAD(P)-binding Rossmann-fold superfamily protein n=1 Tax=Hibiscus syriacus TaxID=106335 RepID=A0A6A3BL41_HIBSY|nr:NAD(P)-binding Rossmann-fold superfamily protein [Hibiscus syriacus]
MQMNRPGVGFSDSATKMSEAEKVVCVTGASGFIGSWLVKLLLQRGYSVNATVRDPSCIGVFHTASPYFIPSTVKDPQAGMVEPALKGTLNVLRACAKVPSIKRVLDLCIDVDVFWHSDAPGVLDCHPRSFSSSHAPPRIAACAWGFSPALEHPRIGSS